jgi:AcrR family transcriptional regulator
VNSGAHVKRRYASPLRQGQAMNTRTAVIEAAWRLFAEQGYAATSIEQIARAAGVSRATVFTSVGGKPLLLKSAFDVAIVGDDEPAPLPDRPESQAIRAEPDPRVYLERYARLVADMGSRLAPIAEAVRGAAGADANARELWNVHLTQRRTGAANVISDLLNKGGRLREGLDRQTAADILWVFIDPGLYGHLVFRQGWTPERFRTWLGESMLRQLLAQG